ncbi:MAG: RDD family protein [Lachnospiraceae bacterium]|nr:RDD family protein [Lachnospiraceae bacterium]
MQNHNENRVYAGFFVRLLAFGIDSLIAAIVAVTVTSPFSLAANAGLDFFENNFLFHYSFLDVLNYVAAAAYFVLLTYFTHTTPGKALFRLEVVTEDKDWTILNIIYRETVGRFFSSLLCAGYFAVAISARKQGFHDMLCDTFVVYKGMVPVNKNVTPKAQSVGVPIVQPVMQPQVSQQPIKELVSEQPVAKLQTVESAKPVAPEQPMVAQTTATPQPVVPQPAVNPQQPVVANPQQNKVVAPTYYSNLEP